MKKIVLVFLMLVGFYSNAQIKTITVSSFRSNKISAEYYKDIDLETNDTLSYVAINFYNAEFSSISDYRTIKFKKQTDLDEFIKDLKTALPELGTKQVITWNKKLYSLRLEEGFSNILFLTTHYEIGYGYTMLKKNDIEKLLKWFTSFSIGNSKI